MAMPGDNVSLRSSTCEERSRSRPERTSRSAKGRTVGSGVVTEIPGAIRGSSCRPPRRSAVFLSGNRFSVSRPALGRRIPPDGEMDIMSRFERGVPG